jgi:hypothetical protein
VLDHDGEDGNDDCRCGLLGVARRAHIVTLLWSIARVNRLTWSVFRFHGARPRDTPLTVTSGPGQRRGVRVRGLRLRTVALCVIAVALGVALVTPSVGEAAATQTVDHRFLGCEVYPTAVHSRGRPPQVEAGGQFTCGWESLSRRVLIVELLMNGRVVKKERISVSGTILWSGRYFGARTDCSELGPGAKAATFKSRVALVTKYLDLEAGPTTGPGSHACR